ncbi:M20 family metallopeptidase [Cohnella hashimotonis]|uniref:M20 family metallopeptidase n=1 Tax=Cohnella hashimotonis TaxID=2826895 RepID=A0ABT6T9K6_9BACL|nr:M20 family metallopeptidase [Cohnella hashimotonis]MDI4643502.1 M20 family metallopeptidase [Cohnella hashimotonis]
MNKQVAEQISRLVDEKGAKIIAISDEIWDYAEIRFEEFRSSALLADTLEAEGFVVERGVAELETGLIASFGSNGPVVAILGEFDALAGLSQQAGVYAHNQVVSNGSGHGCGHHLLGAGALAAAIAVKDYLQQTGMPGTVRYYGCPAEESGYGKTYMVREGCFADVDIALSWHPFTMNVVMSSSSLAVIHATFRFQGKSTHAAVSPHLGRSALDAVELMNVGVNYMREHMIDQARIHYAVTNSGGTSPNVVQRDAEVTYLIRAPKSDQVKTLYERVVNAARGAALMTETAMEHVIEGACVNLIPNTALEQVMHDYMSAIELPVYTDEELTEAKAAYASLPDTDKAAAGQLLPKEWRSVIAEQPLINTIAPYSGFNGSVMGGSTDVADVSWVVPTAQCMTATYAFGTPFHAWQTVAQGKSSYAHKAMLFAGKTMACTAVEALLDPALIAAAKAELAERLDGEQYECLVPKEISPPRASRPD